MATQKPDKLIADDVDVTPDLGLLRSRRSEILEAAARHGAKNVRVFGSTEPLASPR